VDLKSKHIGLIGVGRVGSWLARLLSGAGCSLAGFFDINRPKADQLRDELNCGLVFQDPVSLLESCDIIFLAVADDALSQVVAECAPHVPTATARYFIHMSGFLSSEILGPLRAKNSYVLSMHPCRSIPEHAHFSGRDSAFVLEGDGPAVELGLEIVAALEGRPFLIRPEQKPVYHFGAAIISNFMVTLFHEVTRLYQTIGFDAQQVNQLLQPLLHSTMMNIAQHGPAASLTGPIARGDIETVRAHLEIARGISGPFHELVRNFVLLTIDMAARNGYINEKSAEQLRAETLS